MRMLFPAALLLALASPQAMAQRFIQPGSELPAGAQATVTLVDGTTFDGRIGMVMAANGTMRSLTVKGEDGTKHKLKAADVAVLKVKVTGIMLAGVVGEDLDQDLQALMKGDFDALVELHSVVYNQAMLPGKKEKYALLQTINPGWDHRIQVYEDPNAQQTTGVMGIGGGDDKSYIVVKDGARSVLVKKKKYKEDFYPELFADCKVLTGHPGLLQRARFRDFPVHVWIYEMNCGATAAPPPPPPPPPAPEPAEDEAAEDEDNG